jgi:flagellin-like hook-associated protein FlgL
MGLVDISLTSAMRTTLFSLQNTSAKVERTQERLATGKRVNTALDNPTNFFAAQAHLNRAGDLNARKDGMSEAIQTGDAAHTGLKALASMIDTAKGIANSAHSASPSDRTSLAGQFNQILGQIDSIAADSSYRGTNLLNDDVLTVNFNEKGSSNLTIQGMNATSLGLEVQRVGYNSEVPITAGWTTGYAITPGGQVVSFGGSNFYGENVIPVAAESGVTSVSAGSGFALALKSDGTVVGWGNDTSGQSSVPLSAQSGVTAIAAGSLHSLALKDDGSVIAWGSNTSGQTSVPAISSVRGNCDSSRQFALFGFER